MSSRRREIGSCILDSQLEVKRKQGGKQINKKHHGQNLVKPFIQWFSFDPEISGDRLKSLEGAEQNTLEQHVTLTGNPFLSLPCVGRYARVKSARHIIDSLCPQRTHSVVRQAGNVK